MTQVYLASAAWKYPLADDGFMLIGRIAVMWSSIEISVNLILKALHRLDNEQFAQFIGKQAFENKVSALQKAARRAENASTRAEIRAICPTLKALGVKRNAAVHGMWGWRPNDEGQKFEPYAYASRGVDKWLSAEQLVPFHNEIAEATKRIDDICVEIAGFKPRQEDGRTLYIGKGRPSSWHPGHEKIEVVDMTVPEPLLESGQQ